MREGKEFRSTACIDSESSGVCQDKFSPMNGGKGWVGSRKFWGNVAFSNTGKSRSKKSGVKSSYTQIPALGAKSEHGIHETLTALQSEGWISEGVAIRSLSW